MDASKLTKQEFINVMAEDFANITRYKAKHHYIQRDMTILTDMTDKFYRSFDSYKKDGSSDESPDRNILIRIYLEAKDFAFYNGKARGNWY